MCSSLSRSKIFNCTDHVITTSKELKHFYDRGKLVDVVLVAGVDDIKVQAHRLVLSASSSYFGAMFDSDLKESDAEEVILGNIDGVTLKLILDFLYCGTIKLQCDTVERLLKAADCFQITSLICACCDFMADELDPCNCLGICLLAEQHNYTMLYEESRKFVYDHFGKVYAEKEFLHLNNEQISKFLVATEVDSISAKLVLYSVVAWVEHDKPNREQFVCSLLSHVRFESLDPKFIIEETESICKSNECRELILKWLMWHLSLESRSKCTTNNTEARTNNKLVLGGFDTDTGFVFYEPVLEKWSCEKWPHPRYNRQNCGMIVLNDKLIIAGGEVGEEREIKTVEWLDLQTIEWTELPPMKETRCLPGLAELNGHLYVVGGQSNSVWLRSMEVFDFTSQTWTYSALLPRHIADVQVAVLNGLLYVGSKNILFLDCYNPSSCKWSNTAPRNYKSDSIVLAANGGHLYAAGIRRNNIRSGTLNVERYDPKNNTWIKVKSSGLVGFYLKCATLNNRLILSYTIWDGGSCVQKFEEYDPEIEKWKKLIPYYPDECEYPYLFTIPNKS